MGRTGATYARREQHPLRDGGEEWCDKLRWDRSISPDGKEDRADRRDRCEACPHENGEWSF